jgi:serine/threonine-protein kinase
LALEEEARLLHAATRARLVDHDKGTAALLVYSQLRNLGAAFSFGQFLVERGLLSQMALEGLERNLASGSDVPARTISRLGDFELLELLGEGQTGSVFRARQVSLERPVAIKVLSPRLASDPEALERFLNEARVCARLKHPHIIQFYRLAKCEGLYYIAMELAPGGSLRKLLAKQGRLEEQHALTLSREVAAALAAAHQAGLLHRDVKPENILLDEAGQAKLADLGIAVRTAEGAGGEGSGEFWGTPDYLAPEVITGEAPDDARSDLYSLGATLFEVLAGAPPFPAKSPQETLRHQVRTPPPDLRGARADLLPQTVTLVMRLLAKDPAARFPDAQSLVEAFDVVLGLLAAASPAARPARMAAQRRTPAAGRLTPAAGRGTPSGRERAIPRRPGLGGGPQPGPGGRPRPGTGPQDGPQRRPYRR